MMLMSRTSVYQIQSLSPGRYKLTKIALLSGRSSTIDAGTWEGDCITFNDRGHIVLYAEGKPVIETSQIVNL